MGSRQSPPGVHNEKERRVVRISTMEMRERREGKLEKPMHSRVANEVLPSDFSEPAARHRTPTAGAARRVAQKECG